MAFISLLIFLKTYSDNYDWLSDIESPIGSRLLFILAVMFVSFLVGILLRIILTYEVKLEIKENG